MPSTTGFGLTGNLDIDGVLSGIRWTDPHITFSFPTQYGQYGYGLANAVTGFQAMNSTQVVAVRAIMGMYQSVSGLVLSEVTETSLVHGTVRFGEEDNAGTAYAYYPSAADTGGDVWLNHTDYNAPLQGTYAYATFMHEIGHAFGLDHGQDGLAALPTNHDSLEYSVMTYRSFVGADLSGYTAAEGSFPQTLMLDDIAAIQYMYGANYATNSDNTTYSWSPTTGEMLINGVGQGAPAANKVFMTVWDGAGNDTYDLSNYTANLAVDLRPGGWTSTGTAQLADLGSSFYPGHFARGNIASAYLYGGNTASLIENAVGGSGNDTITGNQANNVLNGGAGNDTLTGGIGNDTIIGGIGVDYCVLDVNYVDCAVTYDNLTSIFSIQSLLDGLDHISGVEYFRFVDQTLAATTFIGPDLTPPSLLSTTPADNAQSVAVGTNLVLSFSEAVVGGVGEINIHYADGSVAAVIDASDSSQVSVTSNIATINPTANLAPGSSFYVTIEGDAFRDAVGNFFVGITGSDTFNFTTAASIINGTSKGETLNGSGYGDIINGLGGNDTLNGNAGDDTLDGGVGSDKMAGGFGNDSYIANVTGDVVTELSGQGTDTVRSAASFMLGANIENLILTGSNAIGGTGNTLDNVITGNGASNSLSGANGNDTLLGGGGADKLNGGAGNDVLTGGLGKDVLTGGTGQDQFAFDIVPGSSSSDKVTDFSVVDDTVVLKTSVYATLSLGSLDVTAFHIGTASADASDRIVYNSSTGALYYDPDGTGAGALLQFAALGTGLALTAADFLLVA